MMNLVLSSLSFRIFTAIQDLILVIQASSCAMQSNCFLVVCGGPGLKLKYSWVPLTCRWWMMLCFLHNWPSGAMYRVSRMGRRTLPCGTPKDRSTDEGLSQSVLVSLMTSHWVLLDKYDFIHDKVVPFIPQYYPSLPGSML